MAATVRVTMTPAGHKALRTCRCPLSTCVFISKGALVTDVVAQGDEQLTIPELDAIRAAAGQPSCAEAPGMLGWADYPLTARMEAVPLELRGVPMNCPLSLASVPG